MVIDSPPLYQLSYRGSTGAYTDERSRRVAPTPDTQAT